MQMPGEPDALCLESCPGSNQIAEDMSSHPLPSLLPQVSCTKLCTLCEEHRPGAGTEQHGKRSFWKRWFDVNHMSHILKSYPGMCQICLFKPGSKTVSFSQVLVPPVSTFMFINSLFFFDRMTCCPWKLSVSSTTSASKEPFRFWE